MTRGGMLRARQGWVKGRGAPRGRFWKHLFRGIADASFSVSRSPFSYPIKLEDWGPPSGVSHRVHLPVLTHRSV
jgi:hypothetical protein